MSTAPVDENELLFRQVSPGGDPIYFDETRKPPVFHVVFLPGREDHDGLSMIRNKFRTEIWSAYRLERTTVRYRLACLNVSELNRMSNERGTSDLTYNPSPDGLDNQHGEPWAHCCIAEINKTIYDSDQDAKKRIKEWARHVSDWLSRDSIIGPFREPTEADPYRPTSEAGDS